jgi:hypothetical protein
VRVCRLCNKELPLTSFHKNGTRKYRTDCIDCRNAHRRQLRKDNKETIFQKENTPEYKEKSKAAFIKRRYDLTIDQFQQLEIKQNNCCAICNKPEKHKYKKKLSIDHNHVTGKVRGLLCHSCNVVLGLIKEDLGILESIKQYLKGD